MGLFRKTVSVSTLGLGARYRNKEERAARDLKKSRKALQEQSRLLKEQNRLMRGN